MKCPNCKCTRFYLDEKELMCRDCGWIIPHNENLEMYQAFQRLQSNRQEREDEPPEPDRVQ